MSHDQLARLRWLRVPAVESSNADRNSDTAALLKHARAVGAFASVLGDVLYVFAEATSAVWTELRHHCATALSAPQPWSDDVDLRNALLLAVRDHHRAQWALVPGGALVDARAPASGLWRLQSCIAGDADIVTGACFSARSPWRALTVGDCVRAESGASLVAVCVAGMGQAGRLIGVAECSHQAARLIADAWRHDYSLHALQPDWCVICRRLTACMFGDMTPIEPHIFFTVSQKCGWRAAMQS